MTETNPTVKDFALEVVYTVAVIAAASVVIFAAKKSVRKLKNIRLKKSEESA